MSTSSGIIGAQAGLIYYSNPSIATSINISLSGINSNNLELTTKYNIKFSDISDSYTQIYSDTRTISDTTQDINFTSQIDVLSHVSFDDSDFLPSNSETSRTRKLDIEVIFELSNGISDTVKGSFDVTIQTPSINATGGESYKFTDENDITYRIHVFNTTGEHTIEFNKYDSQSSMDVLVVGGGGGGASHRGGGGGAGGLIFNENININQNQYSLTVGDGGMGADSGQTEYGSDGDNSVFDSWNATGGGGGAPYGNKGRDGGSGGGSGTESQIGDGGSGISGQGNDGGGANDNSGRSGLAGGGGGAGSVGEDGLSSNGRIDNYGDGGIGLNFTDLFGTSVGDSGWFAGGGGGGLEGRTDISNGTKGDYAKGGLGGGGNSGKLEGGDNMDVSDRPGQNSSLICDGENAILNTGGGGGGGNYDQCAGGNGGSGVIIIRYQLN